MEVAQAFQSKINRKLGEFAQAAPDAFKTIEHELAAKGLANSGGHIKRKIALISSKTIEAVNWCFNEFNRLPGNKAIWRELELPYVEEQLSLYFQGLVETSRLADLAAISPAVQAETERLLQQVRDQVKGEFEDMRAGLWSPRGHGAAGGSAPMAVTETSIHNVFHGDFQGVLQQAGAGATQHASFMADPAAVEAALAALAAAMETVELSVEQRGELIAEIETIRPQLRKAAPNWDIARLAAHGMSAISLGVAGNLLTPHVQGVLTVLGIG